MDEPVVPDKAKPRRRESTPAQRAVALLVRREHSRKELAIKLRARGIDPAEADAAVEKVAQAGWQDDTRFACSIARTRAAAGYGPIYIRAELATHGLGEEVIALALSSLDDAGEVDWAEVARAQVRRRFGDQSSLSTAVQHKAASYLMRRGFGSDIIRAAIRSLPDD
ncbi:MAG TPA: regulatory protein RecX [Luteimonas sp.]|nr:regulatory protein RecX [Luteimonas sp.]